MWKVYRVCGGFMGWRVVWGANAPVSVCTGQMGGMNGSECVQGKWVVSMVQRWMVLGVLLMLDNSHLDIVRRSPPPPPFFPTRALRR